MITRRNDPVIWTDLSKNINDHVILHPYEENGIITFNSYYDTAMIASFKKQMNLIKLFNYPGKIMESNGTAVRSLFNIHKLVNIEQDFITEDLIKKVKIILDSDFYIYQSHINFKEPFVGGGYYWHSDYTYWKLLDGMPSPRAVTVIIPMETADSLNGTLFTAYGSHHYYCNDVTELSPDVITHSETDHKDSGLLTDVQLQNFSREGWGFMAHDLDAGSVTFMDANLVHSSVPNYSPYSRNILFIVFNSIKNIPIIPEHGGRSEHYTNRDIIKVY